MDAADPLAHDLSRLTTEGGTENRLVLQADHGWLIFTGSKGRSEVLAEAAASVYLPPDRKLRAADVHRLRQAGFASRPDRRNLARTYTLGEGDHHPVKVADDAREILRSVYGVDLAATPPSRSLHFGDRDDTENPALIDAIRALSRARDPRTRNAMYRQMLRATFLLPVDDAGAPVAFGELQGFPVFGVFSDPAALRWWDPIRAGVEHVPGRRLFPMLARTGLGSVLINPEGRVGGELYRNEVQMLADAAR